MSVQPKIRVLVVDDHPVVRTGLGAIVSSQRDLELVGEAATAAEAIALFEAHSPDISLVDLSLPDRSGVEVIATLRAKSPLAKFVVLPANLGSSDISKALQAGAHAYLFKDATSDELLTTIRTISRGGRYLSPAVGSRLDKTAGHPDLTARELEVLRCLIRGLSNAQVARKLAVTEETVKTHVGNILGKLGVASRSKAVALSLKSGLVQLDDM